MVCSVEDCEATHWTGHPLEDAERLGWRNFKDGKQPQLALGIALCPDHEGRAGEFPPRGSKPAKSGRVPNRSGS